MATPLGTQIQVTGMSENALGKASDSCSADGKDSSVECPTCGKGGFCSVQYMKVHHNHAHGESIAGVGVSCGWCDEGFKVSPHRVDEQENFFCSDECLSEFRSNQYSGENHPRYIEDKPVVECGWCEVEFEVWPSKEENTRFCSWDCKNKMNSEEMSGEDSPHYNRVECECEICGDGVSRKPSHYEKYENVFCSQSCHREYQSIHQAGENHHNYDGGRAKEYGPDWHKQRRKAIERDCGECQACGVHRENIDRDIHVHHRIPRKKFIDDSGVLDHKRANALDNLVCLCPSCHTRWEGIPLKPTLV